MIELFKKYYSEQFILNKYNHLLTAIIFILLVNPFVEAIEIRFPVMMLASLIILVLTFRAIIESKKVFLVFLDITTMGFVFELLSRYKILSAEINTPLYLIGESISVAFYILVVGVLTKRLIAVTSVTADTVKGGICLYFLMGMMWSVIYSMIYYFDSTSFQFEGTIDPNFMYYSYTVLTTLGFGDITPVNRLAVNLTNLESIAGQMFLAVFIARLIGIYLVREFRKSEA